MLLEQREGLYTVPRKTTGSLFPEGEVGEAPPATPVVRRDTTQSGAPAVPIRGEPARAVLAHVEYIRQVERKRSKPDATA